MKRAFLLIVIPALVLALGFSQTPTPSVNTDQTNIKGCLGGSDGNYTVSEDGTGRTFKITTSGVDLKQHLGHDVTLIGHRASGTSSAAADNSFAVTELTMISEHCAPAAAPTVAVNTTSETASTPAAPPAPAAAVSSAAAPTTSTSGNYRHPDRCSRYDCQHPLGQTCGGRCSPNATRRAFSERLGTSCCGRGCTRRDCQQVLGACQYTRRSGYYTGHERQLFGDCHNTRCSPH